MQNILAFTISIKESQPYIKIGLTFFLQRITMLIYAYKHIKYKERIKNENID